MNDTSSNTILTIVASILFDRETVRTPALARLTNFRISSATKRPLVRPILITANSLTGSISNISSPATSRGNRERSSHESRTTVDGQSTCGSIGLTAAIHLM